MANIGQIEGDDRQLSLTPLLENTELVIPPSLVETNSNNITKMNNLLALTTQHHTHKPKPHKNKSKPAFVMKLWTMVNDEKNQELINWVDNGKSFLVSNRELFVQKILPKYFKHSNFASFVRQLNMYGWHKVQDASSGSLHSDERWQFLNPNFQKDKPELLEKIVRNKPNEEHHNPEGGPPHGLGLNQVDVGLLISELNTLKANQIKITQELSRVRNDNDLLWQELYQTREKNELQNGKIEQILQFLASVYGSNSKLLENHFNAQQLTPYNEGGISSEELSPNVNGNGFKADLNQRFNNSRPRLMLKQDRHVSASSTGSNNTPIAEIDNSPIQEIIRNKDEITPSATPSNVIQPYELNDYLAPLSPETSGVPDAISLQPLQAQNEDQPEFVKPTLPRPPLDHRQSYKELSKSIEQQGQSIDELISKLSGATGATETNTSSTPLTASNSGNFDIDEFLSNEGFGNINDDHIYEEDDDELDDDFNNNNKSAGHTRNSGIVELDDEDGEIEEIKRDNDLQLKRKEEDEIEEIINPKKRRSGNFQN